MKNSELIKIDFPTANIKLLISQGIDSIMILPQFEKLETPEEYYAAYMDCIKPTTPLTYKENGILQCDSQRNRSFTDLFAIVRAKFQDLTLREFAYMFIKYQENGDKQFFASYCSGVKKIVNRCHKSHPIKIPAHWILKDGIYIMNQTESNLVSDLDISIDSYRDIDGHACDGVFEHIILKLANNYLKFENNETPIIKD